MTSFAHRAQAGAEEAPRPPVRVGPLAFRAAAAGPARQIDYTESGGGGPINGFHRDRLGPTADERLSPGVSSPIRPGRPTHSPAMRTPWRAAPPPALMLVARAARKTTLAAGRGPARRARVEQQKETRGALLVGGIRPPPDFIAPNAGSAGGFSLASALREHHGNGRPAPSPLERRLHYGRRADSFGCSLRFARRKGGTTGRRRLAFRSKVRRGVVLTGRGPYEAQLRRTLGANRRNARPAVGGPSAVPVQRYFGSSSAQ